VIVQFQGGAYFKTAPKPWEFSAVLTQQWRLIDGKVLFNIQADPAQRTDVSDAHPDVVKRLRSFYQPWWDSVSPRMTPVSIDLGNPRENPTMLCSQDWYMESGNPPWNFGAIRKLPRVTGPWNVNVKRAGRYRLTLHQWPAAANKSVIAVRARVQIAGQEKVCPVKPGSQGVVFEMDLPAGSTQLWTHLYDDKGIAGGAYFTEVERL